MTDFQHLEMSEDRMIQEKRKDDERAIIMTTLPFSHLTL